MNENISDEIVDFKGRLTFFDYITLSTLNVAVGAYCLSLACIYAIVERFDFMAALIPGLITYVGYTFDNISGTSSEDRLNKPKRIYFSKKYGKVCFAAISIIFLVVVIYSFIHSVKLGIAVLVPEIAVILYSVDLEKQFRIPRLKKILLFKNIFTILIWVFVVVIIPHIYLHRSLDKLSLIAMIQVFEFLFINALVCDINDVEGDLKNGVKTVPVVIGRRNTFITALTINTVSIIQYFLFFNKYNNDVLMAMLVANIYTYGYIFYYMKKKESMVDNTVVDFVLIVPLIVFVIWKVF